MKSEELLGPQEARAFDRIGERRFRLLLERVSKPFRFSIVGGDDRLDALSVELLHPPWLEELSLAVRPLPTPASRSDASALKQINCGCLKAPV